MVVQIWKNDAYLDTCKNVFFFLLAICCCVFYVHIHFFVFFVNGKEPKGDYRILNRKENKVSTVSKMLFIRTNSLSPIKRYSEHIGMWELFRKKYATGVNKTQHLFHWEKKFLTFLSAQNESTTNANSFLGTEQSAYPASTSNKIVEHCIDGISFLIKDNSNIYKSDASNTAVVLLHGCYGSKKNFWTFSNLIKSNKIILVDLRNHGNSKHSASMKYEDIEKDITNVVKALKMELKFDTCCLTGFSIGGKVAMYSALKNPNLFSKLIVMDMLPFNYYTEAGRQAKFPYNVIKMSKILFHIKKEKNPKTKKEFLAYFKEAVPEVSDMFAMFLCSSLKENKEKNTLCWKINVEAIYNNIKHITDFPLDSNIYTYRNPCSFIIGSKSDLSYGIPNFEHVINNFFPNSKKFVLNGSSHTVYMDQPQRCAEIINDLLLT